MGMETSVGIAIVDGCGSLGQPRWTGAWTQKREPGEACKRPTSKASLGIGIGAARVSINRPGH